MWTKSQIKDHEEAARRLLRIKDLTFAYIGKNQNISEKAVADFVLKKFKELGLATEKFLPIVAFNENSAVPHYQPGKKSKRLSKNTIIKLDIWARLKKPSAPYVDITWMAYFGKNIPKEIQKAFDVVEGARDSAIKYIKKEIKFKQLPFGRKIDWEAREVIKRSGYGEKFIHGTGHSLGTTSPHGKFSRLNPKSRKKILPNVGYTIEPGIYFPGKFGVRLETDFYVDENYQMYITSGIQKRIIKI